MSIQPWRFAAGVVVSLGLQVALLCGLVLLNEHNCRVYREERQAFRDALAS